MGFVLYATIINSYMHLASTLQSKPVPRELNLLFDAEIYWSRNCERLRLIIFAKWTTHRKTSHLNRANQYKIRGLAHRRGPDRSRTHSDLLYCPQQKNRHICFLLSFPPPHGSTSHSLSLSVVVWESSRHSWKDSARQQLVSNEFQNSRTTAKNRDEDDLMKARKVLPKIPWDEMITISEP